MKPKTFLILLVCVALLGAVAFFTLRSEERDTLDLTLGQPVLADLPFDRIDRIRIASGRETVEMGKTPRGWGVAQKNGYPADFAKISDLVEKLRKMKIGKRFSVTPEIRSRLALHPPGDASAPEESVAVRLTLLDGENRTLADLLIGNARSSETGYGGQYLMHFGRETVFLADQSLKFLETEPAEWIHRKVVDLDVGTIRSVALYRGNTADPVYRLERQKGDAGFTLNAGEPRGPLETGKVDRVVEALSPLRTEDVLPAENPGLDISFENADRFEFRTEDGWRYAIKLGPAFSRQDETYTYARVEKSAAKNGDPKAAPPETAEETGAIKSADNELGGWIYVISNWKNEDFIRDPKQLVKAPDGDLASES
ncbi:MAG: DUF4340 domain-containing protein [Desulfobacterales bacterium]|nr:DUF4340 domain-containing protein [Desulfobacterales bacterium]